MLQLGLAAIWLLDGVLQYQSFMFTKAFGQMIGATSAGNPGVVAHPINWNATLVEHHLVLLNAIFATIQLLLGLGIAYRPTVRLALAASIAWALGVWWFGEGLGGVLSGAASPLNGAPGAVIIYALLAVLLWPSDRITASRAPAPFVAARAVGASVARGLWVVLWGSLAYFALTPASRAPTAVHDMIAGMADGEPGWLAALDRHAASLVGHSGLAASIVLAAALIVIAARRLPAAAAGQGHADPGHRGGRGHLGHRGGIRRHPGRRRHRSQLRPAARPAGAGLLAARARRRAPAADPAHRPAHRRDTGMSIPAWILDVFAAVMLLVAAVSAGQLVVARAWTGPAPGTPTSPSPTCSWASPWRARWWPA